MQHAPVLLSVLASALFYLDPGSGSLIMQVLIATLLGGALLLKRFWAKIFHKGANPEDEVSDADDDDAAKDE
jgi:hypothetical protein